MTEIGLEPLLSPDRFRGLDRWTHLAAGGETPALWSHDGAAARFLTDKSDGMDGRQRFSPVVERARAAIAGLSGLAAAEIAFVGTSSEGIGTAAAGLDLSPGDNLVCAASEFPSVMLALQSLAGRGVEIRRVGDAVVPEIGDFAAAIDARTRAIAVSHVSHLTGARIDLLALRALADRVGARLLVDVSHSLGVVAVDGSLCDCLVACCYKWLLGVHGVAVFGVNAARWPELPPRGLGWHAIENEEDWRRRGTYAVRRDISRFEPGNLPFLNLYLLENGAAELASLGVAAIEPHVLALSDRLGRGLRALGLPVVTPEATDRRAGNVSFLHDEPLAIVRALRERNILVWGGEGRVRASAHVYNSAADVDRLLAALRELT